MFNTTWRENGHYEVIEKAIQKYDHPEARINNGMDMDFTLLKLRDMEWLFKETFVRPICLPQVDASYKGMSTPIPVHRKWLGKFTRNPNTLKAGRLSLKKIFMGLRNGLLCVILPDLEIQK